MGSALRGMTDRPLLEVVDLDAGYTTEPVLRRVSMTVQHGEVVALLGANGAGKSTLLKTISALVEARHGGIWLDGESLVGSAPYKVARAGIAHVLEGRGILPSLTVRENLLLGVGLSGGKASRKCQDAVALAVDLFPRIHSKLENAGDTLSGGEQQMVALARALASKPKLLLLDEPSQGLAPTIVSEVFATLRILAERGQSILLVEQYAYKALSICNRGYVMQRGTIAAEGSPSELRRNQQIVDMYLS